MLLWTGNVNNIPIMQFWTGIPRITQLKSCMGKREFQNDALWVTLPYSKTFWFFWNEYICRINVLLIVLKLFTWVYLQIYLFANLLSLLWSLRSYTSQRLDRLIKIDIYIYKSSWRIETLVDRASTRPLALIRFYSFLSSCEAVFYQSLG